MKLLRIGKKGNEKPAVMDKDGKIRDISSHIQDLKPDHLNFDTITKLQSLELSSLPELSSNERIGSCITNPGKTPKTNPNKVPRNKTIKSLELNKGARIKDKFSISYNINL